MICALFVDDRLLHGQIAFKWTHYYQLDRICVINDDAANDEFTKMILELAKPRNVSLSVAHLNKEGIEILEECKNSKDKCLIIVASLFDAIQLINLMPSINKVNITGLREKLNSKCLNERVYLSKEDVTSIKRLLSMQVDVCTNLTPKIDYIRLTNDYLDSQSIQ